MEDKNYYELLEVPSTASPEEITAAKNALAKKYHPDANLKDGIDTTEQMQAILEAYAVLSDPVKRSDYDRKIAGRKSVMQTFDLHEAENEPEAAEPVFVTYWKASNSLYDIIVESDELIRMKNQAAKLGQLAMQALKHIIILRQSEIPERYWHPDIMNWLLFTWLKNRNYTAAYLVAMYDDYLKKEFKGLEKLRMQNKALHYQRSEKKFLKY